MNKSELRHKYKKIAYLLVEKNQLIGKMNGWCGSVSCRNAKYYLDLALKKDEKIQKVLDGMFAELEEMLPDAPEKSIISEALKDTKVKNDLSKMQKKDGTERASSVVS